MTVTLPRITHNQQTVKVEEEFMAIGKVRNQRSWKYKDGSFTPFQELVDTIVFIEYENPNVSGHVILMVGSGGSRRRSITQVIFNLRTLVKLVEQNVEGLEEVVEHMEILDKEKIAAIRG